MIIYQQELKKVIKDKLIRDEKSYKFINKLIVKFINLNDKLYKRA